MLISNDIEQSFHGYKVSHMFVIWIICQFRSDFYRYYWSGVWPKSGLMYGAKVQDNSFRNFTSVNRLWTMDNGLLFHMTQPTNRSATRSHCTKQNQPQ